VKKLEEEGIGRPSTYASIIAVIQNRNYVEQRDRRFYATDLGEVVTDKMIEAFPDLMDVGYTRQMEAELDEIEDNKVDWVAMLRRFYTSFSTSLEEAHEGMAHAKAEIQPALYKCPKCGSRTCYRFGRNGRFLSCTTYPECDYAAPIDRRGRPLLPERVDVRNPEDGSSMELRNGRFGPFLASINYPASTFVLNLDRKAAIKYPSVPPLVVPVEGDVKCPKCDAPLNLRRGKRGPWLGCSKFPKWLDTDYNEESFFVRHAYFLGANDPYKALKTTLKAEIDEDAWESLYSDTSRPFAKPKSGRIAVKVINHLGDEVMKVFGVE
jgi:DNA topoisomerase-1